mgnify:CR=1 FL=1
MIIVYFINVISVIIVEIMKLIVRSYILMKKIKIFNKIFIYVNFIYT